MAERPIFIPSVDSPGFVKVVSFDIPFATGFAPVQKQKNVRSLHAAAAHDGYSPLLEISSKSEEKAGRHLSAFHLKVDTASGLIPLENAFQGSKVFEHGGPYIDLYQTDPRSAKRDPRLKDSGRLVAFELDGNEFPLQPSTVFYDWLYLNAIYPHREWLRERIDGSMRYAGYTDIEFNPNKSINCQAKSCALFVSLTRAGLLDKAMNSAEGFIAFMSEQIQLRRSQPERANQLHF
ncbi:DUF6977 family protein [Rhizobium leguminosarum]|uniref:DarT1-associated NADAR antitoxin family protein n=1 Tax=Rhizobium leguminosarum TaxID=384 RepID=UPI001C91B805|nr:hypothetical protein [Rhizobium leguminosarum]MBY2973056.1 hypothetical protein [Rhizobium leguminosarum]MBY2980456.1 hypothetical protein [Rhizobium leguminosarum]MBY3009007.1 hypothetical protein [Rhizobium leguminosarum]